MKVQPPLFVLGHWRSGTTHLHNLLSHDPRFACPNLFQVVYPHTFLHTEKLSSRLFASLLPRTRIIDGVSLGFELPYEDEFALCVSTLKSPYLHLAFPRRLSSYDRYLTLRDVRDDEITAWNKGFLQFARKLTRRYNRPLIFKSPPHTGRIRLLLELFPDARFVHIHRNPYTVFQSTKSMWKTALPLAQLQRYDFGTIDQVILRRYREMYDAFFEDRELVAAGRFHELAFEDLERDPVAVMRRIYDELDLPGFDDFLPGLERYLESLSGYRKNRHSEIPDALRQRIAEAWRRSFDEWGYAV